jgi:hypothetical protein
MQSAKVKMSGSDLRFCILRFAFYILTFLSLGSFRPRSATFPKISRATWASSVGACLGPPPSSPAAGEGRGEGRPAKGAQHSRKKLAIFGARLPRAASLRVAPPAANDDGPAAQGNAKRKMQSAKAQ